MKKRYWTKLEEDILEKRYIQEKCSRQQIARELNRTEGSIKAKLKQKGWVREFRNNPYTNEEKLDTKALEIESTIKKCFFNYEIATWAHEFLILNNKKPCRKDLVNKFPDQFPNYRRTVRYVLENDLGLLFDNQTESNFEIFISEALNTIGYEYIQNYRQYKLEVDFYIPSINVGIEMNDTASHNTTIGFKTIEKPKDKYYHKNKTEYFLSKNIKIVHLYEKDLDRENFVTFLKREINKIEKSVPILGEPKKWKETYLGETVDIYDDGVLWKSN